MNVWTDGNCYGYYAYITEDNVGTIGSIEPLHHNQGKNMFCAEIAGVCAALENVKADPIKIHCDSQNVIDFLNHPICIIKPNNEFFTPYMLRLFELTYNREVEVMYIKSRDNKADIMLKPMKRKLPPGPPSPNTTSFISHRRQ